MYSLSVLAGLDRTSLCLAYQPLLPTLLAIDKIYGFVSSFMNGSLLHDQNVMENQTTLFWHLPLCMVNSHGETINSMQGPTLRLCHQPNCTACTVCHQSWNTKIDLIFLFDFSFYLIFSLYLCAIDALQSVSIWGADDWPDTSVQPGASHIWIFPCNLGRLPFQVSADWHGRTVLLAGDTAAVLCSKSMILNLTVDSDAQESIWSSNTQYDSESTESSISQYILHQYLISRPPYDAVKKKSSESVVQPSPSQPFTALSAFDLLSAGAARHRQRLSSNRLKSKQI